MDTDQLAELIGQKREILQQLHELSLRQSDMIQQGEMARLISLLAAKQAFLRDLQDVERQLDPFRGQDPERRRWRSPDLRQRVQQAVADSEGLLKEIMRIERECETELGQRRDGAAARLQGVHDASVARRAYLQESNAPARRLDLSSES